MPWKGEGKREGNSLEGANSGDPYAGSGCISFGQFIDFIVIYY
jgi:hypothetical protein